ncbi:hypothetical protein Rctr197k_001 [Virus Rctr197k]|nr:hypothetical protein Rctr197k_001 [Virus Rctr197k]
MANTNTNPIKCFELVAPGQEAEVPILWSVVLTQPPVTLSVAAVLIVAMLCRLVLRSQKIKQEEETKRAALRDLGS